MQAAAGDGVQLWRIVHNFNESCDGKVGWFPSGNRPSLMLSQTPAPAWCSCSAVIAFVDLFCITGHPGRKLKALASLPQVPPTSTPGASSPPPPPGSPPPPPPLRPSLSRSAVTGLLYGTPVVAMSQGVAQLPDLRPSSDVGRRLWLGALAGSAPLGYLAQTAPTMPDRYGISTENEGPSMASIATTWDCLLAKCSCT